MTVYAEVIGHPISHSKSPLITISAEQLGLVGDYRAHDVCPDLERIFDGRRTPTGVVATLRFRTK